MFAKKGFEQIRLNFKDNGPSKGYAVGFFYKG